MTDRRAPHLPARPGPALLAGLAAWLLCGSASAQSSPWFVGLSHSITRSANLLELADGQETPAGFEKADTVSTTSLLAGFDQRLGRQRAYANATLRDTRHARNSVFNNHGYSARTGLDWSTAERISGSLNLNASRSLQRFNAYEIGFLADQNLESVKALNARISVGLVTQFSLELAGGRTDVKNSLDRADVQSRNFNQDNASLGLQWRPSSATTVGAALGVTQGRYPKFRLTAAGYEADRFKRNDVQLTATHRPTGASSVELRLSSGKTTYDLNQQRDFSGLTGSATWFWQATGKLFFVTSYTRDTGQDSYATAIFTLPATADYSRSNRTLRWQADYAASAKLSLTGSLMRYSRDIVRTIENPFVPLSARGHDNTLYTTLGLRWTPRRYLQLACDYGSERRRGEGELVNNLRGSSFGCSGQVLLQ